jgi:hypothetical protein
VGLYSVFLSSRVSACELDIMIVQKMTRKGTEGLSRFQWIDTWYHQGENVELDTLNLTIPVDDIYENVILPPLDPLRRLRKRRKG